MMENGPQRPGEAVSHNAVSLNNIEDCFTYQPAADDQLAAFDEVRAFLIEAGARILRHCPPCRDREIALEQLRDARMWANSAIAHRGRF